MKVDIAIIGGTGIGERLRALGGTAHQFETNYGVVDGLVIDHHGVSLLLLSRHSAGHKVPPHHVNYRGLASALKQLEVKACLASAAVGSLRPDWTAGTFATCSDFLDYTNRQITMFDETVVHTDFTEPFSAIVRAALIESGKELGQAVEPNGVYICTNGPRYETPHEIRTYQQLGGDVIGMTAATEAIVMRESGVPYGCLAIVTNAAAGITNNPLTHEEVVAEMESAGERAVQILLLAAQKLA